MLVDDHPLWRTTMRQILNETDGCCVVAEAGDGNEALVAAAKEQPDVVLMDVDMPNLDGVSATAELTRSHPSVRVLVLSASDARDDVLGALGAGASGYLLKTSGAKEIRDGVMRVAKGEVVIPPQLTGHLVESLRTPPAAPSPDRDVIDTLTGREREILSLMAEGYSNPSICSAVHLSQKTVEGYIASIFTKLGLEPTRDRHRRVLAVLAFLESRRGNNT